MYGERYSIKFKFDKDILVEKFILTLIQMCRSCHVPFLCLRKKFQTKSAFNYACVSRDSEGHLDI